MARRPYGGPSWRFLRPLLVARARRVAARFDAPTSRAHLAEYEAAVLDGAEVELSRDVLFLALWETEPRLADTFTATSTGPARYVLTTEDRLEAL